MAIIKLDEKYIKSCSEYFPKNEIADIVHAATCLQKNSILITNDKHFDKISEDKIIEVWSISKAIENLLS
jgi:predicted nucleic acid-binding protein